MWKRIVSGALVVSMLGSMGCAQRHVVPGVNLMRGDVVENVHIKTTDGYTYDFDRGYVRGETFFGTLVEDVEELTDSGDVYLREQAREIPIPISSIVKVEQTTRSISSNTVYVVGAIGAGAILVAALSGSDLSDVSARSTGVASKPNQ